MKIFAGIIDRKSLPDGPALQVWKSYDAEIVFFHNLYLTQDCLVIEQLLEDVKISDIDDDYIHVALWQTKMCLYNGHHRAIKAALRGEIGMLARVHRL